MTQTAGPPARFGSPRAPSQVKITSGQLVIAREFLTTGDPHTVIAERLGVSRNLVSQQLLRVARRSEMKTAVQLMAAIAQGRVALVEDRP